MNKTEINRIYQKYNVPLHVRAHMRAVAKVASFICKKLKEKNYKIKSHAVLHAALLHDVLRVCDFRKLDTSHFRQKITATDLRQWRELNRKYGKIGHVTAMKNILIRMNEPYLALLVEKHDFFKIDELNSVEEKIIFYADKRAEGDKIVDLKTRFREGTKRNAVKGENFKRRRDIEQKILKLEKEFEKIIGKIYL